MKALGRSDFWWPSIDKQIEECASNCKTCTVNSGNPFRDLIVPWAWRKDPWTKIPD